MATQLSATPPAMTRWRQPVAARAVRASRSTISSVTCWIASARSMWTCVSSTSGARRGRPNSRSHDGSCTMRRPVANSKCAMLSTSDPSGRMSTSSRVMVSANALDARAAGVAVRRQAHQLVLAAVHRESEVVGERGIEQAHRVGEVQLAHDLDVAAAAAADGRGRPFADAVDGQDGGLGERRGIEGARRVRQVVLGIEDAVAGGAELAELVGEQAPHEQLLLDPGRHGRDEAGEAGGCEPVVGLEQALEFQERLVVERHTGQVVVGDPAFVEHVAAGVDRKRGVVALAREAFFLGRRGNLSVDQQRGRAVVVEGGDAEDGLTRH